MKPILRHAAFVFGTAIAVFACSSSETAGTVTDAAVDGADAASTATCELHDGACGTDCCEQPGGRYDETRDCVEREHTIGCSPKPASTSCGLLGVVGCYVTPAGTFMTSGLSPGWTGGTSCDEATAAKVTAAKGCTTSDAGAD
jgi:hypothetical protein